MLKPRGSRLRIMPKQKLTMKLISKMYDMLKQNYSRTDFEKKYNVSKASVTKHLKNMTWLYDRVRI